MSAQDFQPGDRVEYVGDHTRDLKGKTGTVLERSEASNVYVDFGEVDARRRGVYPSNLKKVEDPKPEIRVGDRVRLTLEGEVTDAKTDFLDIKSANGREGTFYLPYGYDVEILERKVEPLKPGTIVRDKTGATYVVIHDGSARFVKEDGSLAHHTMFSAEYWARAVASPTDSLRILE